MGAPTPVGQICGLGHVGIHVSDLERAVAFYRDILGLEVTDASPGRFAFLSSQPDVEHHELLLAAGRDVPRGALLLQQISWRCSSLEDIVSLHYHLKEHDVVLDMEVSHGNAIGIYFYDPDGNRIEVYWRTGLKAKQPYLVSVDLEAPVAEILQALTDDVAAHGETGHTEPALMPKRSVPLQS